MSKQEYQAARALVRGKGKVALRWIRMRHASIMLQLMYQRPDPLAEKMRNA